MIMRFLMWMCYNYLGEAAVEQNYAENPGGSEFLLQFLQISVRPAER